jgi:hypothetical protein
MGLLHFKFRFEFVPSIPLLWDYIARYGIRAELNSPSERSPRERAFTLSYLDMRCTVGSDFTEGSEYAEVVLLGSKDRLYEYIRYLLYANGGMTSSGYFVHPVVFGVVDDERSVEQLHKSLTGLQIDEIKAERADSIPLRKIRIQTRSYWHVFVPVIFTTGLLQESLLIEPYSMILWGSRSIKKTIHTLLGQNGVNVVFELKVDREMCIVSNQLGSIVAARKEC